MGLIKKTILPRVSVVVTNYNYGKYIRECIESVYTQDYPHVECIVVDDCSRDDSVEVIRNLQKTYDELRFLQPESNGGQSAAMALGFGISTGEYIIFLDADDYFLPNCISSHINVHLSSRVPVGFTSVDMVQLVNGKVVTLTSQGFSDHVRYKQKSQAENLYKERILFEFGDDRSGLDRCVYYVAPYESTHWPWSPTSGNCFRRDALELVIKNVEFSQLKTCSDIYLLRGVGVLAGSILIDRPLAIYRIHGRNDFVQTATLHRVRIFSESYLFPRSNLAMKLLLSYFIRTADTLIERLESPNYLEEALLILNNIWPPLPKSTFGMSYLTLLLIKSSKRLRMLFGYQTFVRLLVRSWYRPLKWENVRGAIIAIPVLLLILPALRLLTWIDRPASRNLSLNDPQSIRKKRPPM